MRFVVLDSGDKKRGQWVSHKRDLPADTHIAFGHGFVTPPHLIAVVVGVDSGNTQGSNVAYLGDISPDLKTAIVKPPE